MIGLGIMARLRDVETQLAQRLDALVGEQLGGIEALAEHLLRIEQGRAGQLAIGGGREREKFAGNCCILVTAAMTLVKSTRPLRWLANGWPSLVPPRPLTPLIEAIERIGRVRISAAPESASTR